ncbi:SpvB/TcaC N-terminal domain-containing protein [Kangiella sp. HZ709]|uniref:SpvB/TcaC N-terminal domain-containing protein n=1 Tax=Kangiella sp. HZ709 TaxID=2666328 RepID=UPI0012B02C28|nr:SpvB/TcaC N-terminal domain-containing protein [Kangiella sp. HZ709]MRX27041.1 hypothetical protein [Kangiella sp. HZ709]
MNFLRTLSTLLFTFVLLSTSLGLLSFPGGFGSGTNVATPASPGTATVPATSSTGSYSLSWSQVDGETHYRWREYNKGSWSGWTSTAQNVVSASMSGRDSGTYRYEVQACNFNATVRCSAARVSNDITVSRVTSPGSTGTVSISDGSSSSDGSYTVSWGVATNSPTRYEYQESINNTWGGWVSTGLNRSTEIVGNGDGLYSYRVRACNTAGCGSITTSSSVTVTLPTGVGGIGWKNTGGSIPDAPGFSDTSPLYGDTNVGAVEGSGGVSGGAANYSIPIVAPPGRAGMQPSVSLSYSSRSGNGIAGVGWSLSAGSSIHRCSATHAQDVYTKAVTYSLDDKLCLDGQRLIRVGGSAYGQSGAVYYTELDSFARITQNNGDINSSHPWFKVEHKDGRVSIYGGWATNLVKAGGRNEVSSWNIGKVSDPSGNNIWYDYYNFQNGEVLLKSISYTGHGSSIGDRHIRMEYANRPDVSTSYMAGGKTRRTQRLSKIKTQYQSTTIREYTLSYGDVSLSTQRSVLREVEECAYEQNGAKRCLLPTKFEWLEAETQYALEKVPFADHSKRWLDKVLPHGDFNGDGVKDWPNKYTDAEGNVTGTNDNYFSNCYRPQNGFAIACVDGDFNQDGKTDKFKKVNDQLHIKYQDSSTWINTGIAWSQHTFQGVNSNGQTQQDVKADYPMGYSDFNGDGLVDIAFFHTNGGSPELRVYWNSGNHSQPFSSGNSHLIHSYSIRNGLNSFCGGGLLSSIYCNVNQSFMTDVQIYGDIDGNGTADFVVFSVQGGGIPRVPKPMKVILSHSGANGYTTSEISPFSAPAYTVYPNELIEADFFADINGDGLTDWLSTGSVANGSATHSIYVKFNKGGGQFDATWQDLDFAIPTRGGAVPMNDGVEPYFYPVNSKTVFMDYDGDGKNELLIADTVVASGCALINGFTESGAPTSDWFCDDAMYRNYVQSVVGGARAPANPSEINADVVDDSVRKFDAIYFNESANGDYSIEKLPTQLVASATQYAPIDSYGNGLTDFVTVFGCRWAEGTDCKWNTGTSGHAATVQNSSYTEGVWVMRNKGAAKTGELYQPIDMMLSAEDALERKIEWIYKPLSTGTYKDNLGNNFYEVTHSYQENDNQYFHFASSMYAVASMKQSDGIGGLNESRYRYRGAMYNTQGRGFQGFKQIIVDDLSDTDVNKHLRSVSDFHQKFPLSGKLEQTRTCLINNGGEDCQSKPITKTSHTWDLWSNGLWGTTVYNALTGFSNKVYDGISTDNRYWVAPVTEVEHTFKTSSSHGGVMSVDVNSNHTNWISEKYRYFQFDGANTACPKITKSYYQEPNGVNRTESKTESSYSSDINNWWLCRMDKQKVTTYAVSNLGTDYSGTQSGTDFTKAVETSFVYDLNHWKPKTISTKATEGQGTANGLDSIVNTSYNSYGLPTSIISDGEHYTGADMADRSVTTSYTSDGYFVSSVTNSKGHVTTTEVDPIHGQATKVTDPNNQVTTMTYDAFGRVHSTKLPGEPTQYTAYNWCSGVNGGTAWCFSFPGKQYRVYTVKKGTPRNLKYFDSFNREHYSITRNFEDDHWYYTLNKFDNKGQKTHEAINDSAKGWQYTKYIGYDALGRLTEKETPQASGSLTGASDSYLITNYSYDGFETNINAGGLTMARKYNGLGQLVWTKDAHNNYTRYAYDGAGNPISLQDANGNAIYAKYNALGHKEYVDDPNMGKKYFWYNTFGEVEKEKDANLTELTYSYDELGRMTQRWTNGTRSGYWYWDNSNALNYRGMLRWEYNVNVNNDRLIKYHYYTKTAGGKLYSNHTKHRIYTDLNYTDYDILHYLDNNFGRPKGMRYVTTGLALEYEYNELGYMTKIKNANGGYVYQEIKDLDAHGKITNQLKTNGLLTESAINTSNPMYHPATGQMMSIRTATTFGDELRHELTYTYDDFSNLEMQTVRANGVTNAEDYDYDGLHRLVQSQRTINNGSTLITDPIQYNYDAVGNFTKKGDYVTSYAYGNVDKNAGGNAGPNAARWITKKSGGTAVYQYDNNGNMESGDGRTITYNEFNKPLTIHKNGITSSFSYGADLMRYKQVKEGLPGGVTETTYYVDKLFEKVETKVNLTTTKTVYKHYIGDVAIQNKTVTGSSSEWDIRFTHRDRLGSVITLTDDGGQVTEHRSYDAFGKPRKGDFGDLSTPTLFGSVGSEPYTDRGFTDHEHLDDAELIHMNGRAYDYNLGRFLSVDPFIQEPGNSQSMNPYSYIMNNPLSGTDPTGYMAERGLGKTTIECGKQNNCGAVISAISSGGSVGAGADNGSESSSNVSAPGTSEESIDEINNDTPEGAATPASGQAPANTSGGTEMTLDEYKEAVKNGLWSTAQVLPSIKGNRAAKEAGKRGNEGAASSTDDVVTTTEYIDFMKNIYKITVKAENPSDDKGKQLVGEKHIALRKNDAGEVVVSGIAIGLQNGAYVRSFINNTKASVLMHFHYKGIEVEPGPADHTVPKFMGIPNLTVTYYRKGTQFKCCNLYEVGRVNGQYRYRDVKRSKPGRWLKSSYDWK